MNMAFFIEQRPFGGDMATERFSYDDATPRQFLWATLIWGIVGMLVGLIVAIQLFLPQANIGPWLSFGRLRPLHTNAVIFAFCGNAIFAGIYHSSQRLLKTRMWSDKLSKIHLWGWQLIIVSAALTLPFGFTTSKEYAELEWPIKIAITLVWVVFAVNYFMTMRIRREKILYVSIWFYVATIVTIAMLHIVNSLSIPVSPLKSYSLYSGVQDALVQWWYGHNAVAFFLTTPFLGLAYYYIPKAANEPIYSYRLSIIHFWSLIFIYIWAGPHHLQNTSLPNWLQSLGMVFSVMLLAPSWGGAINFVLTLRQAWSRVKTEPVIKFFAAGTTFYMMATFEGPLLSIKSVNGLAHNTDWIIAHVHSGALGWNGLIIFGMMYYLVPKLYQTELFSKKLANLHFWTATSGILLYIVSMWISGVMQGVMSRSINSEGLLNYPVFVEIVTAILPLHYVRAAGGALYLGGVFLMAYNLLKTAQNASALEIEYVTAPPRVRNNAELFPTFHKVTENWGSLLVQLSAVAVIIGSVLELVPMFIADQSNGRLAEVKPYTPLELEGRDIYIREGCNNCHTQMVRAMVPETKRYGVPTASAEHVYEHPHLWGSKRTGPDLQRIGGKYGNVWHWKHMIAPRSLVPQSIMPAYEFLADTKLDTSSTQKKMTSLRWIGVPYSDTEIETALEQMANQSKTIADDLTTQGEKVTQQNSELLALIAYLQRLGKDGQLAAQNKKTLGDTK